MELIRCLGTGLERRAARDAKQADHLDLPIRRFRLADGRAGEDRAGRGLRIRGVGLPAAPPTLAIAPLRPVDLDHRTAVGAEPAGQAGPVTAGTLDHDGPECPILGGPGRYIPAAGRICREAASPQPSSLLIEG